MTDWEPLRIREGRDESNWMGPYEGVPTWMFGPLWQWICDRYYLWTGRSWRRDAIDEYRAIAAMLRLSLEDPRDPNPADGKGLQARLHFLATKVPDILLDVADYWLHTADFRYEFTGTAGRRDELGVILDQSGSVYHVQGTDSPYLARRVAPEVQSTADTLMRLGRPGEHIDRAWRAVYGRPPDPSDGYAEAIKAVEAAAKPVVSPNNDRTTLGTIIRDMRAKPEKWAVQMRHHSPEAQVPAVIGMLDILQTGQVGRHGADGERLDVTQPEAEAALHLALTLVHWFTSGVVTVR